MDNLTFTKEQKEQLKNNVRAIERYIEENVIQETYNGDVVNRIKKIYPAA